MPPSIAERAAHAVSQVGAAEVHTGSEREVRERDRQGEVESKLLVIFRGDWSDHRDALLLGPEGERRVRPEDAAEV